MYQTRIKELAPAYEARHIKAFMRLEFGTLDHLSPAKFKAEVEIACACIDEGGNVSAEALAKSFGL
jgi:hypothetical protein